MLVNERDNILMLRKMIICNNTINLLVCQIGPIKCDGYFMCDFSKDDCRNRLSKSLADIHFFSLQELTPLFLVIPRWSATKARK